MCIIAFSWQPEQNPKLRLLSNRDEFYQRPTLFADFWSDQPAIFGGRDQQKGGSWLLSSHSGRIAAVTNYREVPVKGGEASRGAIPLDFINSEHSPTEYAKQLSRHYDDFPGFNALFTDGRTLVYASNRLPEKFQELQPGIYCVSNGLLNSNWPKVQTLKARFTHWLTQDPASPNDALALMLDTEKADEEKLPNTGIGPESEKSLSSIFIEIPGYGTRNSTFLDYFADRIEVHERQYVPEKRERNEVIKLI